MTCPLGAVNGFIKEGVKRSLCCIYSFFCKLNRPQAAQTLSVVSFVRLEQYNASMRTWYVKWAAPVLSEKVRVQVITVSVRRRYFYNQVRFNAVTCSDAPKG